MSGSVYANTVAEFYPTVVDLSTNSTTVTTRKAILRAAIVKTTMSAHACVIQDNATAMFTIPASTVAGTTFFFGDVTFASGIVVNPDDSGTGEITLVWMLVP